MFAPGTGRLYVRPCPLIGWFVGWITQKILNSTKPQQRMSLSRGKTPLTFSADPDKGMETGRWSADSVK